jgi:hypothetical protein
MWLYDSNLTQIEYDDDGGSGAFSSIERTVCWGSALDAGTYYVKIDEYNNNEIPSYNLQLTLGSVCPDPAAQVHLPLVLRGH